MLYTKTMSVENANQLSEIRSKACENATIDDLAFQPNSNQLSVIKQEQGQTLNGNAVFLDTNTLEQLKFSNEITPATALTFSIDGSVFVTGTIKETLRVTPQIPLSKFGHSKQILMS